MLRTKSKMFWHTRASNSKVNSAILPEFELDQDFTPVQIICKFNKDPIKSELAMLQKRSNKAFFVTKGQVTLKSIVRCGPKFELV